jgi:hypothetical protein
LSIDGSGDALHVAAEIADLVEGVPGGNLKVHTALHVGHFHSDMEEMLLGVS